MIEVDGLRKSYGDFLAVDDVSFTAKPGKIFGLLGPNGAGKSTTIGCISGLLTPTDGHIRVNGHDVVRDGRSAKQGLGVVPQELSLYEEVSATENLLFWGAAYGMRGSELKSRVHDVLRYTSLLDRAEEPVKNYSGGMKRRINFGCAIMHRPKVLLLDEPTVGVDPQSRVRLFEMVKEQVEHGTAVLYTTHYMQEAELLCDELAIVDHGKLIADGTLEELRGMVGEKDILRLSGTFDPEKTRTALAPLQGARVVVAESDSVQLAVADASRRLPEIFEAITTTGGEVRETTLSQPSLETLFLKLTGKEMRK